MDTVLILAGIGFLLLLTEMALPGGVLGALGGILLVAAIVVGYINLGPWGGSVVLVAIAVVSMIGFSVAMAIFPRTAVGRKMTLAEPVEPVVAGDPLIGCEGEALTPLRPAGKAMVSGHRLDVVAEGEFVDAGAAIVVTACEGARVAVRKKA